MTLIPQALGIRVSKMVKPLLIEFWTFSLFKGNFNLWETLYILGLQKNTWYWYLFWIGSKSDNYNQVFPFLDVQWSFEMWVEYKAGLSLQSSILLNHCMLKDSDAVRYLWQLETTLKIGSSPLLIILHPLKTSGSEYYNGNQST